MRSRFSKRINVLTVVFAVLCTALAQIKDQDPCEPFSIRLFLGDYYLPQNPSSAPRNTSRQLTFMFNTQGDDTQCPEIVINFTSADAKKGVAQQYRQYASEVIDTADYSQVVKNATYKVQVHTYHIGATPNALEEDILYNAEFFSVLEESDETTLFSLKKIQNIRIPCSTQCANSQKPTELVLYGDYGAGVMGSLLDPNGTATHNYFVKIAQDSNRRVDAMVFLGDLVYDIQDCSKKIKKSDTCDLGTPYEKGDQFFRIVEPYWSTIPQFISFGNHDALRMPDDSSNFDFIQKFIRMPNYENGKSLDFLVRFKHVVIVNCVPIAMWYQTKQSSQQMLQYLRDQLRNLAEQRQKDPSNSPFVIVVSHFPLYYTEKETPQEDFVSNRPNLQRVEDLVLQYKVDMYISAHTHAYQRFDPVANAVKGQWTSSKIDGVDAYINANAPVYVVDGAAGQHYYTPSQNYESVDFLKNQNVEAGVAHLIIHNSTHLEFQQVSTVRKTKSGSQEILDHFWVIKTFDASSEEDSNQGAIVAIVTLSLIFVVFGTLALVWHYHKYRKAPAQTGDELSLPLTTDGGNHGRAEELHVSSQRLNQQRQNANRDINAYGSG